MVRLMARIGAGAVRLLSKLALPARNVRKWGEICHATNRSYSGPDREQNAVLQRHLLQLSSVTSASPALSIVRCSPRAIRPGSRMM